MASLGFKYGYFAKVNLYSGGYDGEDVGVDPPNSQYVETDESHGSQTYTYHYTDSNYLVPPTSAAVANANGSRVYFEVHDEWEVSRGANNVIYIDVTTTVNRIYRGGIQGNPNAGGTATRDLKVTLGSDVILERNRMNIGVNETYLSTPVTKSYRITIQPEGSAQGRSSVEVLNHTTGYDWSEPYTDHIGVGTSFYNLLPKEFSHRLVYHYNNGDPNKVVDFTSREECTTTRLDSWAPTRTHWIFQGWSTDSSATHATLQPGDSVGVCRETHVYAVWKYTYRPGMHRVNGTWYSCDRDGSTGPLGRAQVLFNRKWIEMRIREDTNVGLGDPPCILKGSWGKQHLIGKDGTPHDISWDCPHQWNKNYN